MARGVKTTDDIRAAVMAAFVAGMSNTEISKKYHVPRTTIIGWREQLPAHVNEQIDEVRHKKQVDFDALFSELAEANLQALISIAKVAADPAYLRTQTGHDIAVLSGVIADKTFYVFEAARTAAAAAVANSGSGAGNPGERPGALPDVADPGDT